MSRSDGISKLRGRRGLLAIVAAAVVVLVAVATIGLSVSGEDAALDTSPVFPVKQGPLTISVTESGTITAREQVVIKSQVEGRPTIIFLIDEGVFVEEGELLVQLDSSGLESDLLDQEIKVQNAEAALIQAQEGLEVAKNQAQADVAQAKLDYEFAKQDLQKYLEGEYPMALMEAETNISLADEELKQAAQTFEWSEQLFAKNYLSANELEKDRLALKRSELEHKLALEELKLLEQYTKKREIEQLRSDEEQARLALDRTVRSAKADVVKAESGLRAKQLEYNRQKEKFEKIKDQIAKCSIRAPRAGMVVYATTGGSRWRNREPLQEGQEVRERQELIKLPTASAMAAEVKIHESSLDKVAPGQPVRITVDALPEKVFRGRVAKISPLPDAQSVWMNPDLKVYDTIIEMDGDLKDLRTGMTCRAEIVVDHYPDATYVPVQSVVRIGRQPTVYVRHDGKLIETPVELGLHNNRMVRVLEGLEPGQLVSLTPPLAPAQATDDFAMAMGDDDMSPAALAAESKVAAAESASVNNATVEAADATAVKPDRSGASPAAESESGS